MNQVKRLANAPKSIWMQAEKLEFPTWTMIQLNIALAGQPLKWKKLDELSKRQKATAVLLLLLSEHDAPLIIDQPEDDLDNRFITEKALSRGCA